MRDQVERGVAQFGEVVRRNGRRHTDGDALCAVGQHVGEGRGQHDRLPLGAGVIVAEVDRILVDAFQQQARDLGHPRLGVAVGGGAIAVDVAEIALAVDERVARGKVLREAHQRVVDRLVAVRVERAHHVADDLGALAERGAGIEPQHLHPIENAPVHRLQPVARIRERPPGDGRERVGEVALLQRLVQRHRIDAAAVGRQGRRRLGHGSSYRTGRHRASS